MSDSETAATTPSENVDGAEFTRVFGISPEKVPAEAAEAAKAAGLPLDAGYALWLARAEADRRASLAPAASAAAQTSPGPAPDVPEDGAMSLDELRNLPQSRVRGCCERILKSFRAFRR